jgi:geranylgeranyl reductase family protein
MPTASADVAIVGAGPAGSWAAYLLARRGARVALFDPSHPREKPCGGGITGRALALVAPALESAPMTSVAVRSARFVHARSATSARVALEDAQSPALVVASRTAFDSALLAAARTAGAEIVRQRVTAVVRGPTGFHLTLQDGTTQQATFLIAADGANSPTRRQLTSPFSRAQLSIATGFFVRGVTSDEIVIELVDDPPGYLWSFPRPDHLAVGICAQADHGVSAAALRARAAAWIDATLPARGARLEPYSWPIPSLGSDDLHSLPVAGPGWLLVGDAAGLVDPITREGIFFALESAVHAAAALSSATPRPDREYGARLTDDLLPELARAARFKARFFEPRFAGLLMDALAASEPIRRVMADLVAGRQPYRGLKWRLARTFELGLAWRVLSGRASKERDRSSGYRSRA